MSFLKSYIDRDERREADRQLPKLMFEGLLLSGSGLGVLALIFEIAADAFSVAAYQTLLAIHGADGYHEIAIAAFIVLSVLLFLGIVPAYKAGAYLRPNAGGSGPLVEAIGPPRMRWLSWVGTSLFFLDAVLTIIISSISASDVTMLILPELAPYRILLAEGYAFFIMVVLVLLGPKRAVPLFLIGGGAFTIFTIVALSVVGAAAAGAPEWAFLTDGIVARLEATGVVEHVVRAQEDIGAIGTVVVFQLFFRSMSSAMLGFSGYEVIPASGKHAARPKWKVINTALTLAAVFLISTGVVQLFAARQWNIPSTEGYSTLLIEYEIVAVQMLGNGVEPDDVEVTAQDRASAEDYLEELRLLHADAAVTAERSEYTETLLAMPHDEAVEIVAEEIAFVSAIENATNGTFGNSFLTIAGLLLAIILLLAQGGGYVGGAAVAANAARLGRLPFFFSDDRIGIAVIWGFAAALIPIIREVVIVESYYAFGFVSAFIITSTTVFFVRNEVMIERGIDPASDEAKSLKFAGLRGMIASYFMGIVLVTQKTDALFVIIVFGAALTLFQIYVSHRSLRHPEVIGEPTYRPKSRVPQYEHGLQRAHEEARQRGIADATQHIISSGQLAKFNVEPGRITRLISYLYKVHPTLLQPHDDHHEAHDDIEEPSVDLEATYNQALALEPEILKSIEKYSHIGIFTFIRAYHHNWLNPDKGRDAVTVQRAMLDILMPLTESEAVWEEYTKFEPEMLPEAVWQFSRERYRWAKDQWPNLSDRITTVWTLQDFGLIPSDVDVEMIVSVASGQKYRRVEIHTHGPGNQVLPADKVDIEIEDEDDDEDEQTLDEH